MLSPDMYEVPLHGMGLFLTRRDTWPGFHQAMHQFAGEEGYIHEKFRLLGRKTWSLPFLGWWHLFLNKTTRVSYSLTNEHKYRNMLIGWREVALPTDFVEKAWMHTLSSELRAAIRSQVDTLDIRPLARKSSVAPFLGYPMRLLDPQHGDSEDYRKYEVPRFVGR